MSNLPTQGAERFDPARSCYRVGMARSRPWRRRPSAAMAARRSRAASRSRVGLAADGLAADVSVSGNHQ